MNAKSNAKADWFLVNRTTQTGIFNMPDLHHHRGYEMYVLDSGKRNYIIDGQFFEVRPMDVVLIPPYALHKTGGDGFCRTLVNFSPEFLQEYLTDRAIKPLLRCFDTPLRTLPPEQYAKIRAQLDLLLEEYNNLHEDLAFLYLTNILALLCHEQKAPTIQSPSPNELTGQILSYIQEHYATITGLDQIAKEFLITKPHLCRLFKQNTGFSVIHYLNHIKLQHACRLLESGGQSITDIALSCGFNSSMYFCRTFKSMLGLTPGQYRKTGDRLG